MRLLSTLFQDLAYSRVLQPEAYCLEYSELFLLVEGGESLPEVGKSLGTGFWTEDSGQLRSRGPQGSQPAFGSHFWELASAYNEDWTVFGVGEIFLAFTLYEEAY